MKVMILLGSKSDNPIGKKVTDKLNELGIKYELTVASAHRAPDLVKKIVLNTDADVFIAIAGLAAALPGVIASHTVKPVIGVPVSGKISMDSIFSMVQMPRGVPVATVGLDNGENAALLAAQMIATSDRKVREALERDREKRRKELEEEAMGLDMMQTLY